MGIELKFLDKKISNLLWKIIKIISSRPLR